MSRLPFDPDRLAPADTGGPARRERARYDGLDGTRPLTVTQTVELIKRVLGDRTPSPIRIVGEVSNFNERQHWYFSLKDETNVLSCVMWASAAKKSGFTPGAGQEVVASGRLDFYGPQGRLQLYVDKLEPVGQGLLEQRFRELCDELRGLGYFDEDAKRALPAFAERVAVVTSESGAALTDVIRTTEQRWGGCQLLLVDVRVQGEGAASDIAAALRKLSARREALKIDAIILTRGGGSLEDLWQFNERVVADAVRACAVPIVAAIGHESDTTIAELVADLRCSTPTQAVMQLVASAADELERIGHLGHRIGLVARRQWERASARYEVAARFAAFGRPGLILQPKRHGLDQLGQRLRDAAARRLVIGRQAWSGLDRRLVRVEPRARVASARQRVAQASARLERGQAGALKREAARVEAMARELEAVGPASVLERGYSITRRADGRMVRSAAGVKAGEQLVTQVSDGRIESRVEGTEGGGGSSKGQSKKTKGAKAGGAKEKDQLGLF